MNMQLSVIAPVYNEEHDLWPMADGLAPVLDDAIGKENWQFVLVNNGSQDRTPEVLAELKTKWPNTTVIDLDAPNFGEALAAGIHAADGEFGYIINVVFLGRGVCSLVVA